MPHEVLPGLERTIAARAAEQPGGLVHGRAAGRPRGRVGEKVQEEAEEVARAAREESDERVAEEAADVLYHLAVLLRSRGLSLADAEEVLRCPASLRATHNLVPVCETFIEDTRDAGQRVPEAARLRPGVPARVGRAGPARRPLVVHRLQAAQRPALDARRRRRPVRARRGRDRPLPPGARAGADPVHGRRRRLLRLRLRARRRAARRSRTRTSIGLPDMALMLSDVIVAFDHLKHTVTILANAYVDEHEAAHERAREAIREVRERLAQPLPRVDASASPEPQFESNMPREAFEAMVARIIEYVHAGDAFQVVPSQRWSAEVPVEPFSIYRGLRAVNPSPYMYFLDFEDFQIVGASPEPLITVSGRARLHAPDRRHAAARRDRRRGQGDRRGPAGRREGARRARDARRPRPQRPRPRVRVRLGRGRVVHGRRDLLARDPHRLQSVAGTLREDVGAVDALRSVLPAGTLSGAPKVRAMEIIDELEPVKRGAYGGAVGWLSYAGELDTCICIRTVVVKDGVAHVQAGGGTVADARAGLRVRGVARQGARRRARDRARGAAGGVAVRVLVVDNYDSFTYNLVQYLGELGAELTTVRNDAADVDDLLAEDFDRVVVSPGPCTPNEAGMSVEVMRRFPEAGVPTLGVCLGHQSLVQAFGGRVVRHVPVHGKATEIEHDGTGLFDGLPSPLTVGRYHSLVADPDAAGLPRGDRARRRRRDGRAPPRAARARRAVPSRVRAHARRQAAAGELPWAMTSSPRRSRRSPRGATCRPSRPPPCSPRSWRATPPRCRPRRC